MPPPRTRDASAPKQWIKSIYFPAAATSDPRTGKKIYGRVVAVAFNPEQRAAWERIHPLTSEEVRQLLGADSFDAIESRAKQKGFESPGPFIRDFFINLDDGGRLRKDARRILEVSEARSREAGRHPFRGVAPNIEDSPEQVRYVLESYAPRARRILDPFSGTGNVPVTVAQQEGRHALYCEVSPLFRRLTELKIDILTRRDDAREALRRQLEALLERNVDVLRALPPDPLLSADLDPAVLRRVGAPLDATVRAVAAQSRTLADDLIERTPLLGRCVEAAIATAVGRAARTSGPDEENADEVRERYWRYVSVELETLQRIADQPALCSRPEFVCDDVRDLEQVPPLRVDAVIAAPPPFVLSDATPSAEAWFLRLPVIASRRRNAAEELLGPRAGEMTRDEMLALGGRRSRAAVAEDADWRAIAATVPELRSVVDKFKQFPESGPEVAALLRYLNVMGRATVALSRHMAADATIVMKVSSAWVGGTSGVEVDVAALLGGFLRHFGFDSEDEGELLGRRLTTRSGKLITERLVVFQRVHSARSN